MDLLALDVETVWPLVVGHDGLLATPDGWTVSPENLTPNLAGPVELAAASTAPMPVGGDRCAQVLGSDDALVSIQYRSGRASPDAPALGGIAALKEEWTQTSFLHCAANASDLIAYWTEAHWAGEFYYLLIVHHRDAPEAVINEALAVANSFVPI